MVDLTSVISAITLETLDKKIEIWEREGNMCIGSRNGWRANLCLYK